MARHDADLDLVRRNEPWTVRPDEQRALALHPVARLQHVVHRNAFGDADHQIQLCLHRFVDGCRSPRRRHVDHRHGCTGRLPGIAHRGIHRDALELLAGLLRIHARHKTVCAVRIGLALLRVELADLAGHALGDDFGVFVDQDAHFFPLAAATTFCAASAMSLAEMMGRPDSARIFLPSSTLVPSRRTTSGTPKLTSRAAATTPSAITSHFMMPPKMLTRMARRFGFFSISLNASVTFSLLAPPPTSRKLAGMPPYSLMMSMVAMARPAPFTRQPMLPSSAM